MEENDAEVMHHFVAAEVTVRVPNRHLERVLVYGFASLLQHIPPRDAPNIRRCYVEHWNITGPAADTAQV